MAYEGGCNKFNQGCQGTILATRGVLLAHISDFYVSNVNCTDNFSSHMVSLNKKIYYLQLFTIIAYYFIAQVAKVQY